MTHYIYIIECRNGALYTGYTTDIERRYQEHLDGSPKCKFTRSFPPKRLAACWKLTNERGLVLRIERKIKKLTRSQKKLLITNPLLLTNLIDESTMECQPHKF